MTKYGLILLEASPFKDLATFRREGKVVLGASLGRSIQVAVIGWAVLKSNIYLPIIKDKGFKEKVMKDKVIKDKVVKDKVVKDMQTRSSMTRPWRTTPPSTKLSRSRGHVVVRIVPTSNCHLENLTIAEKLRIKIILNHIQVVPKSSLLAAAPEISYDRLFYLQTARSETWQSMSSAKRHKFLLCYSAIKSDFRF